LQLEFSDLLFIDDQLVAFTKLYIEYFTVREHVLEVVQDPVE